MCLCVFFMVLLVFYGLHAFCEYEEKERGTSPWLSECGGGCFSCFCLLLLFYQALRASCSSWIIVLLKGLFNLEQKDNTLLICIVTSAAQCLMLAPTAARRRVLTFINDFTHTFT